MGPILLIVLASKYDLFEAKFFIMDLVSKGGKENPWSAFADKICKVAFDFFLKQAKDEIKLSLL